MADRKVAFWLLPSDPDGLADVRHALHGAKVQELTGMRLTQICICRLSGSVFAAAINCFSKRFGQWQDYVQPRDPKLCQ